MEVKDIIKEGRPVEPYCFETDNEETWYKIGVHDGYEYALKEFENNRQEVCDIQTPQERKAEFVVSFVKKYHHIPTLSDAIEETRKEIIEKMELIINNILGGYIIREFHFGNLYSMDKLVKDIRKAIEEYT